MSKDSAAFYARDDFTVRLMSFLGAFTCILAGVLLALSIGASFFRWTFINQGPGALLSGAYGMFAFIIPLYLFWAAWLLLDPVFRPGGIFLFSVALVPFLTLALGSSLIRDFEERRREIAFLDLLGKSGLSLAVTTAVVVEVVGILILRKILFSGKIKPKRLPAPVNVIKPATAAEQAAPAATATPATAATPAATVEQAAATERAAVPETKPLSQKDERSLPSEALSSQEVNTLLAAEQYTGLFPDESPVPAGPVSAADDSSESPPETKTVTAVDLYKLPDWGPLVSPAAFQELYQDESPELSKAEVHEEVLVLDDSVFSPYSQLPWKYDGEPAEKYDGEDETSDDEPVDLIPLEDTEDYLTETAEYERSVLPEGNGADVRSGSLLPQWETAEPFPAEPFPEKPLPADSETAKKKLTNRTNSYSVPVEGILNQYPDGQYWIVDEETNRAAAILRETLNEFGIEAEVTGIRKGPVITMFEILPAPGVKLSRIVNLQDNIALRLAASSVRIVAPIPGKHAVGIEVPNKRRNIVSFREIIEGERGDKKENHRNEIPVVLGKGITGEAVTEDLCQMPHLLIAGATGSGKSVCVNSIILSILYRLSPAECRLILIDPKIVELKLYNDIPHLLTPVITEPKRAFQALQYCIFEMERRYACLDSLGVRDIRSYNRRIRERSLAVSHIPYIVVIIDEFADLMATTGKELESTVARLAAMSRAVGIHLVLATQRPSIDVITGLIKANIPSRIAFMVASKMDSRIIIDMVGAEKLLGKGDMLYSGAVDPFPIRMQGAYISEEEVEQVVEYVKTLGEPEYIDDEMFYDEEDDDPGQSLFAEGNDPLYDKALEIVVQQGKASASYIQRRLKIGYNRAARLVEEMEQRGVVGPPQGSRPRELLRAVG